MRSAILIGLLAIACAIQFAQIGTYQAFYIFFEPWVLLLVLLDIVELVRNLLRKTKKEV